MKKIALALALVTFSGTIATQVYAASKTIKKEIRENEKKKKKRKKKKACCTAGATEQKKCCSSGGQTKSSGCTEKH